MRRGVEEHPFEIVGSFIGGLEDGMANFDIRRADGRLIGSESARYGWDGKAPVDGWVDDPWEAAMWAVWGARERMRLDGVWSVDLPLWRSEAK